MNHYATEEYRGIEIKIGQDEFSYGESPRKWGSCAPCFAPPDNIRFASRYLSREDVSLPYSEELRREWGSDAAIKNFVRKFAPGEMLYSDFVSFGDNPDAIRLLVYVTKSGMLRDGYEEVTEEKAAEVAKDAIKIFSQWCEGEVEFFSIEFPDGTEDCCGDFYDRDYLLIHARDSIDAFLADYIPETIGYPVFYGI